MLNFFTPTAIEAADLAVRIITPDLRGLSYLRAHQPLLTDAKFHYEDHLTFAGLARPFHALDEMDHLIGGFDGLLPYAKEIERYGTEGRLFHVLGYCNLRYINALKLVQKKVTDEQNQEPSGTDTYSEPEDEMAMPAEDIPDGPDFETRSVGTGPSVQRKEKIRHGILK